MTDTLYSDVCLHCNHVIDFHYTGEHTTVFCPACGSIMVIEGDGEGAWFVWEEEANPND